MQRTVRLHSSINSKLRYSKYFWHGAESGFAAKSLQHGESTTFGIAAHSTLALSQITGLHIIAQIMNFHIYNRQQFNQSLIIYLYIK